MSGNHRSWIVVGLLSLVALTSGCSGPRELYTVLPDAGGEAGSLTVTPKAGEAVRLQGAYASARGTAGKTPAVVRLSEQEVRQTFAEALSAKPEAPQVFVLYFREGSDVLTDESRTKLAEVLGEVRRRPAPDVVVVGHTDRVGLVQDNDRLALRRAEKIRAELLKTGLPADSVQAAGRGEREPLVPTADEVAEARNRRVELVVR